MTDRRRINIVVEILKKEGRLSKNDLIRRLEKQGPMARQTASNAIDYAVESQRIFRQDDVIGQKQHIVLLDISPEIGIWEKQLYETVKNIFEKFDTRFSFFDEKYSSLSVEDKAEGVYTLAYLMTHIGSIVQLLELGFGKTEKWTNLKKEVFKIGEKFVKQSTTIPKPDLEQISLYILSQNMLDVKDDFDEVDEFLKQIKDK